MQIQPLRGFVPRRLRLRRLNIQRNQATQKSNPKKSNDRRSSVVRQLAFSPDGQYVATLSGSGKLRLWTIHWQSLLELARDRSLRQLTPQECLRYLRLAPNACPRLPLGAITPAEHGQ